MPSEHVQRRISKDDAYPVYYLSKQPPWGSLRPNVTISSELWERYEGALEEWYAVQDLLEPLYEGTNDAK